jgi:hypothetical protein
VQYSQQVRLLPGAQNRLPLAASDLGKADTGTYSAFFVYIGSQRASINSFLLKIYRLGNKLYLKKSQVVKALEKGKI